MKLLNNKTVLITGCSSGFGKLLVSIFLKSEWVVIATLRDFEAKQHILQEDLKGYKNLFVLPLDIASEKDRKQVSCFLQERFGKLDCLINNAGYGMFGALEDLSESEFRDQMESNFFGAAFLTRQLLPSLRKAGGKVFFISSTFGFIGFPLTSAYCSSKFAMEGLAESLYYELQPHGVQISIIEPGGFRTRFGNNVKWGALSNKSESVFFKQTQNYKDFKDGLSIRKPKDPKKVAQIILNLAERRKISLRYRIGSDSQISYFLKRLLPEDVYEPLLSTIYKNLLLRTKEKNKPGASNG